jgi:hypothetical protein
MHVDVLCGVQVQPGQPFLQDTALTLLRPVSDAKDIGWTCVSSSRDGKWALTKVRVLEPSWLLPKLLA